MRCFASKKSRVIACWLCGLFAFALSAVSLQLATGAEPSRAVETSEPTPEQAKFFETKVRPVLAANCQKCHSGDKPKGDLVLDSLAGLLTGGESGEPAIVPGEPQKSLLIDAINHESFEMPPDKKLDSEEIAALTQWVKIGAPWPGAHSTGGAGGGPSLREHRDRISDEDRAWWAYQPLKNVSPPSISEDTWSRGAIDQFLLARMKAEGLAPAPVADRRALIRRATFDLTGLPPAAEEVAAFVADDSPDAYERLINRLLAKKEYGEHWARYWLDLVRYAESDGYKADSYRPNAWRYRDYVINAFNSDKPYDKFMREQIAGDEIDPGNYEALVATGYYRIAPYEYNQRDVRGQWDTILNEITDVTADVFLGSGASCARCHDHKFDPILQKDYFRLRAFFAPIVQRDDALCTAEEKAAYEARLAEWERTSAEVRTKIEEIERDAVTSIEEEFIEKLPDDIEAFFARDEKELSPLEYQLRRLASRQIYEEGLRPENVAKKIKKEHREELKALRAELEKLEASKPEPLAMAMTIGDVGAEPPPTSIPGKRLEADVAPGVLSVIDPSEMQVEKIEGKATTGRRAALAKWLSDPANPLTPRVIVNRVWQYHFGKGLVESSSDFGRLGQLPSHPELLDHLTSGFIASGWKLKWLHREIMLSAAYCQASHGPDVAVSVAKDPGNRFVSRMPVRRLSAEQVRDAMLTASGELKPFNGGPSAGWDSKRRSIYLKVTRNRHDPLLSVLDAPDATTSIPQRNQTTTAVQSLLLINGPWVLERAKALAARVDREVSGVDAAKDGERVKRAYQLALGRDPDEAEAAMAASFLKEGASLESVLEGPSNQRWIDFCHVMLNSNEFLYVD